MRQLFVLDPLQQVRPEKDSTAALMQAAQRAGDDIWACTPSDLIARGDEPLADGPLGDESLGNSSPGA